MKIYILEENMAEATISAKGQVTIPKSIRRLMELKANDKVVFVPDGNRLILEPVRGDISSLYGSVAHKGAPLDFAKVRRDAAAGMAKKALK